MPISIEEILTQIKPVVVGWIKASIQQSDAEYTPMKPVSALFNTGPCSVMPTAQNLAEITTSIGIITNGEFRIGTGDPTSDGASPFSGVRIGYPPLDYNSASWNLVGVDNDVLQFGLNASNGAAYATGGSRIFTPYIVRQTADQSASTTTLENSNVLYFPVQAYEVWVARFVCPMTMAAAGGLRAAVTRPVSPSSFYAAGIYIAVLGSTNSTDYGLTTTGSGIFISNFNLGTSGRLEVDISIANGANAGNVTLQFAQSASNATPTVIKAGAYVKAQRIS